MLELFLPAWLIRGAVAAVWLYEGLWCKLLGGDPNQLRIVEEVPWFGPRIGRAFLLTLGAIEVAMAAWVMSGATPLACAVTQTLLLVSLNVNGLIWAKDSIHDPAGMIVKNFAFLNLAWVAASLPAWGAS